MWVGIQVFSVVVDIAVGRSQAADWLRQWPLFPFYFLIEGELGSKTYLAKVAQKCPAGCERVVLVSSLFRFGSKNGILVNGSGYELEIKLNSVQLQLELAWQKRSLFMPISLIIRCRSVNFQSFCRDQYFEEHGQLKFCWPFHTWW